MSAVTTLLWGLIGEALKQRPDDLGAQLEFIRGALEKQSSGQVAAFGQQMNEALVRANRWELWGAAFIIGDGCSDDGFLDFRGWLLMQGQPLFEATLLNPDTLAELPGLRAESCECEGILWVPHEVYRAQTGQELPDSTWAWVQGTPTGEPWQYPELERRLPRLWAVCGGV